MSSNTVIHNVIIIAQFLPPPRKAEHHQGARTPRAQSPAFPRNITRSNWSDFFGVCAPAVRRRCSRPFPDDRVPGAGNGSPVLERRERPTALDPGPPRNRSTASHRSAGKSGKFRSRSQLIELLTEHSPAGRGAELVFPSRTGNREQNMLLRCKEVATRAGTRRREVRHQDFPFDLRHTDAQDGI